MHKIGRWNLLRHFFYMLYNVTVDTDKKDRALWKGSRNGCSEVNLLVHHQCNFFYLEKKKKKSYGLTELEP